MHPAPRRDAVTSVFLSQTYPHTIILHLMFPNCHPLMIWYPYIHRKHYPHMIPTLSAYYSECKFRVFWLLFFTNSHCNILSGDFGASSSNGNIKSLLSDGLLMKDFSKFGYFFWYCLWNDWEKTSKSKFRSLCLYYPHLLRFSRFSLFKNDLPYIVPLQSQSVVGAPTALKSQIDLDQLHPLVC